jgi:GNAT superfamily N-acetyltransferase
MPDLLVNLLKLPAQESLVSNLQKQGIVVRRAQAHELTRVREFVEENFSRAWADETSVGFSNKPLTVFIATFAGGIVGFAAYECTRRGFFGPTGVVESAQRRGIGRALLLECLRGLQQLGYVYGIIGGAGPVEFYEKAVGATIIEDSEPGIYTDPLR